MAQNEIQKNQKSLIISPECISNIDNVEKVRKAIHEDIEIKCFYEGSSTLLIGSETVTANAGDVVVINPYEFHATVDYGAERGKYHLFMIPLDFFYGINTEELDLRSFFFSKGRSFKTIFKNNDRLFKILMRTADEYTEKSVSYNIAIKGLLMELFAVLLRDGIRDENDRKFNKEMLHSYSLIEPALRHIRDNYAEQFAVEYLAELCKVSKYYFCRVFKAVTGKTAMEYLRDYRIKVSDALLVNTDNSISEIAENCGFYTSNYFCRCYKQYYGFSPGNRRKHKK